MTKASPTGASTARAGSSARSSARLPSKELGATLPPPPGLQAYTFEVEDDEYAILAFALPKIEAPPKLSRAEREVAQGAVAGLSNAQIAKARGTSVNTVANQLRSIYTKLKIASRIELVRYCATHEAR